MPDLREVFEMTTKQIEPDVDAWREQERHQRRSSRNRRIGAILVAAGLSVAAIVAVVLFNRSDGGTTPAGLPSTGNATHDTTAAQRHTMTVIGDPALDRSYVITMKLLDGYSAAPGDDVVFGTDDGQGLSVWAVGNVFADPCHSKGTLADPPVDPSVDGLVAALASQKGHPATTPTDVELDGYAGKYLEMTVPAGIDVATCDRGKFRTWSDPHSCCRYLEAGQRDLLWIIDVDDHRLVIDAALGPQTTEQDRADRIQMVESIQIEPV